MRKSLPIVIAAALCLVIVSGALLPFSANAEGDRKTVKVGWYESPFNSTDKSGRRSGYAYDYQLKIAAYAGWKYDYVIGSWSDLMQMLMDGEIDLLSDVSYTEERAKSIYFSELPMGTEEYCVFVPVGSTGITSADISSLNGKRVGVNKGSVQADFFCEWEKRNGVEAVLCELTTDESEALDMLEAGELDAYITLNAFGDPDRIIPVCKIGYSDFYFAVSRERSDLHEELNFAMSRIQDENPYYNQELFEKYLKRYGTNAFLTDEETAWLSAHGTVRVGYQDNYLAFCAKDPETGKLEGALKDYLTCAKESLGNAKIDFSATAYPTVDAALEAMKRGEVDCVFPVNIGGGEGEAMNILITPSLMRSDMVAVVRKDDDNFFTEREHIIVAVNEGNPNYDAFLTEHFPSWRPVYYPDTAECLRAVSIGVADCVIISSFRYNNISRLCESYRLTTYSTGEEIDYCFAVPEGETQLYSILAKVEGIVPTSAVNSSLAYYTSRDAQPSFSDFIKDHLAAFAAAGAAIILLILFLLFRSVASERKAKRLIAATETDELTGLYTRNYFFEYANGIWRGDPDAKRDAIVLNIEQFHLINALNGWEFGDRILRVLGSEIAAAAKEYGGIGGRFGADRFDIYCPHTEGYAGIYDRFQNKLSDLFPNSNIRLRMGVKPWQEKTEPVAMFDMARTACGMARERVMEHYVVFDDEMRKREIFERRLRDDLHRALGNFELEVYYQPVYDIGGDEPRVVSAEALVRWQHPEYGLLTPDRFVPLFERSGDIRELDRYVRSQAAKQAARWRMSTGASLPISVNLSRIDVLDPSIGTEIDAVLAENGLDRGAFLLEITESAYTENSERVIGVVKDLRDRGYTVEMDDFGTGYSSLNMLSEMPVDVLKMDRTFIMNADKDERDVQLISLIVGIARTLKIPVVAEGVEKKEQADLLRDLGCSIVQGYYFSRPLHPSEFETSVLGKE